MDVQKLINELAEKEITLWCEGANLKYKAPKGAMTADLLSKIKSGKSEIIDFLNEHGNLQFVRNTKGRYEKFPLTDIQNSYVVGRNTMYELGGVACHGYIEMSFDKVLDIKRLEIAWNKVIQKHDMLRAIVSNSGYQIVQEAVPYVTIQCLDLRITEGNNETDKNDFRRRLANKQYELGKWPMCDLALTVENEKSIIHLSLDMLIADFVSTNIILHDLETFYENPDLIIVPTTLYRDVVLYQNQKRTIKTVERNVAEKYWSDKIPSMGEAPDLRNIHDVMENLKGLLTDNGSMVILEETRTSYILLTSMEFKDGLTGFTDERAENEQTFFTRNQWESVFASHKGEIVFEFPSNESKLDLSGQTIYVTRFVNELEPIRKHDVRMYLEEQVSPYMVPANILVIPEIPLTSNRKVDTKAVKNYFMGIEETNKKGGTELPQTDLEKRIADIWCKELNISNIGRNDSFYLVGGDSLLIAQVIGKMLEKIPEAEGWEWSALLTEMMQTPTIKGIAEKIEAFQKDTDYVIDPCLVQLKKSVKENSQSVAKVLFHAGTGTLTPYNALLSYIEKDSKENEAIIGFTFGDDADYISMETSQTFRLLGEKYGKILNKLGYSNYILIGHCVGGLIALETAQYLQKKNVQVSDVTLISSNIPKQKNQTILSQATDEIYRKTLQSSLDNEILLERIFAKLIGADAYKAGYQVDEERLQQYIEYIVDQGTGDITVEALCNTGGKFEDVAKEFRLLASKSVSERLNALYNIIERPNGELMEHQLKMLNILFRVFSQNFRCVSTYEPKPYYGNMRILCCEIQGGHFYPGFFAEDYETWKPYAKGNLTFDLIKGWHLDCITEPNLGENIKKMLDFNY